MKRRLLIGLGLVLIACWLIYSATQFWPSVGVWFALAVGIGLAVGRWWAVLLAAVPYPVGMGAGLVTGRYAFLGEGWEAVALMAVLVGVAGIALGILLARWAGSQARPRRAGA